MPEWFAELFTLVTGPLGVFVLFILIAWAGKAGIWVWGRELEASEKRANEWHNIVSNSLITIQASIEALERRVPR